MCKLKNAHRNLNLVWDLLKAQSFSCFLSDSESSFSEQCLLILGAAAQNRAGVVLQTPDLQSLKFKGVREGSNAQYS